MKYRIMKRTHSWATTRDRKTGIVGDHDEMVKLAEVLQAQPWTPTVWDERRPIYTVEPVPDQP